MSNCSPEYGGINQIIDELYIYAIKLCDKLKPKVLILENVKGLTFNKNKHYMDDIYHRLHEINYKVQHYIVKGEDLGLPQKRHRLFIIAIRNDLEFNQFNLDFNEPHVLINGIKHSDKRIKKHPPKREEYLSYYKYGDKDLGVSTLREIGRRVSFNTNLPIYDKDIFNTITTKVESNIIVKEIGNNKYEFLYPTDEQLLQASSFPMDYVNTNKSLYYAIGMAVPPLMMAKVVEKVEKHILIPFYIKQKKKNKGN